MLCQQQQLSDGRVAPTDGDIRPHPVLIVRMVGVRRLEEVELDILPLVGEDALLKLRACAGAELVR